MENLPLNEYQLTCFVDFIYRSVLQYMKTNIANLAEEKPDGLLECYEGCSCRTKRCTPTSGCSCVSKFGPAFDSHGRLLETLPDSELIRPVIECNDNCSCEPSCANRVVQHGVTLNLQIFDVGNRGVGVRSLQPINRGTFVCEYSGELLSYESAISRAKGTTVQHNYILAVREHFGGARSPMTTYVDATYCGNVGRFINHSCEPNLVVHPVRIENAVPRVALFALTDIAAFTELTYDYSGGVSSTVEYTLDGSGYKMARKPCLCGSSCCRLFLPYDDAVFV